MSIVSEDLKQIAQDLRTQLRTLGVASVYTEYDGSDNDEHVQTPEFFDAAQTECSHAVPHTLALQTTYFFIDLLNDLDISWNADEGSFGSLTWDLVAHTVHQEHNQRYINHTTDARDIAL